MRFNQEDLKIGNADKIESVTFEKKPKDKFQLVLEHESKDDYLRLAKYFN